MSTQSGKAAEADVRQAEAPSTATTDRSRLRTAALGAKSGLIATVVMTVFRMPISHSPPPTANFWSKYVAGGDPEDHVLVGMVLHLAYGTAGGLLFAALSPADPGGREVEDEMQGVLAGLGFALVMSVFGSRVVLEKLLEMDLDPDERFVFHLSHVVYGLTLGAWYGSTVDEA